jgi:hypothetical protein
MEICFHGSSHACSLTNQHEQLLNTYQDVSVALASSDSVDPIGFKLKHEVLRNPDQDLNYYQTWANFCFCWANDLATVIFN